MIALINIVFLMLIFFLAAAAIAPPLDGDVRLVRAERLEARPPPDAAVIRSDGTMVYRGDRVTPEAYLAARLAEGDGGNDGAAVLRIVPDRDLPARDLVALASALRGAGAGEVRIVTERGLR
ncbi:biopolymer transporter ExbD [Roseibacterium sp. SDUM158017]|uniref:ExbD/TolR family protein n=1 Tax=Roseicyclus salinarum TaxID=3036773 RepID=UPI0024151218|nr:biopolymer transporter ExbD [Roseibacterium sp. SDUM158017]MDG4649652.1 biopolymer transporter ExbD [Roseibacterium sp. SDUM158017]